MQTSPRGQRIGAEVGRITPYKQESKYCRYASGKSRLLKEVEAWGPFPSETGSAAVRGKQRLLLSMPVNYERL